MFDLIRYHAKIMPLYSSRSISSSSTAGCGGRLSTAFDDGRRLVGGEIPSAVLAQPDCRDSDCRRAQIPCRRPLPSAVILPGHERGAINDQDAVGRMGDFEVGEVAGTDLL